MPEPSLPFGIDAILAGNKPGDAWRAVGLAAHAAKTAGRQAILDRPGLPAARQFVLALQAMSEALDGMALAVAEGTAGQRL